MKNLVPIVILLSAAFLWDGCKKKEDPKADVSGPTAFNLVFVEHEETDVVLKPKLIWEQSTSENSPVTYTVYLDRSQDLVNSGETKPVTIVAEGIAQNYVTIASNLIISTVYKWRVVAKDSKGNTTESSSVFTFTTTVDIAKNQPPNSFNLLLPIDGFIDAALKPSLSWQAATDPNGHKVTYDVYFGVNPNPKGLLVFNTTSTGFTIPNDLEYETTYYWWVQAIDQKGAFTNSTVFSFTTIEKPGGGTGPFKWTKITTTTHPNDAGRIGHQVVAKDGKVWLFSGKVLGGSPGSKNDVWSFDGTDWTEVKVHHVDFLDSYYESDESQVVVFNNEFWLFAGTRNNIYNSANGIDWTNVKVSGSTIDGSHWKGKHGHQVVVYNGKMWVIGGTNGGIATNDVWSSTNGVDWDTVMVNKPDSAFLPRIGHSAVVFKNKMWVIGGLANGALVNDVWSSTDGVNWTREVANADFSARSEHDIEVYKNNLVLVGGSRNDDVWYSPDGVSWTKTIGVHADYKAREEHQCIVYNGKMYIFYGKDGPTYLSDFWTIEW